MSITLPVSLVETSDLAFVYVTFPTLELAREIGRAAVEKQLCACVNVMAEHDSIYRWQGNIESSSEIGAVFKTSQSHLQELADLVLKLHPYNTPCFAVLSPEKMNSEFASWIRTEITRSRR